MTDDDARPQAAEVNYPAALADLKTELTRSRLRALQAASAEMLGSYWAIGHSVLQQERTGADAELVIRRLTVDLNAEQNGLANMTAAEVRHMRQFAAGWPDGVTATTVGRLPWDHVKVLLDLLEDRHARDHFAAQALEHGWTHQTLAHQIESTPAGTVPPPHPVGPTPAGLGATSAADEVTALREELAEARRIGTWLYQRLTPGARWALGDTGEWPWLTVADTTARTSTRVPEPDHLAVLRAFADRQAAGEDPYDAAEVVAASLELNTAAFDAVVRQLIHDGYVTGGKLPTRTYVETVTDEGMRAARRNPDDLPVVPADLTFVKVNGGRTFAQLANWDHDQPPQLGQRVTAADGGSERLEAVIVDIRDDGTLVLELPAFKNS